MVWGCWITRGNYYSFHTAFIIEATLWIESNWNYEFICWIWVLNNSLVYSPIQGQMGSVYLLARVTISPGDNALDLNWHTRMHPCSVDEQLALSFGTTNSLRNLILLYLGWFLSLQIASNVIDYKYSLYGVPPDSDEYFHQLSMVLFFFFCFF